MVASIAESTGRFKKTLVFPGVHLDFSILRDNPMISGVLGPCGQSRSSDFGPSVRTALRLPDSSPISGLDSKDTFYSL